MEKAKSITPIFDRVLLMPEQEQQSTSGIIIPTSNDDRSHIMRVVQVGDCKKVSIGDRVVVAKYAGTEVVFEGQKYTLVCEYDILGVLK
ncbi:MAG: co-chaperone GroES [Christensenellaceae bacterium]|nr:co-chaperone GroES [Christensenellaceae bacterium]